MKRIWKKIFCEIPYPNVEHLFKLLITNNHLLNQQYFEFINENKLEID